MVILIVSWGQKIGWVPRINAGDLGQSAIDHLQLTKIRATEWHFTWCNKQVKENRVYSKIDWAFRNIHWLQQCDM